MSRICLRYSKFGQSEYGTVERKAEGGIFIMWWTAELVKGPPPHPACIVVFGSVSSFHHATCWNVQSPWWSLVIRARSLTTCSGDFLSVLHFTGMGRLGFGGCSIKKREWTSERKTHQRKPLCFSIYFSQLCVNTKDMLCAISHIFMTLCGEVVKRFPLCYKKWGRSITL